MAAILSAFSLKARAGCNAGAFESGGNSLNQFIATAVAEKVAALSTEKYLEARALRGSRKAFDVALSKVPAVRPEAFDKMD